jgi:hypothetical protein
VNTPRKPVRPPVNPAAEAIQSIQARLESARPKQRAKLLRRAGDICATSGAQREALRWYGQAIDQLMELSDAETAGVLCRMILYVQPEAVRAHCTLAWLALTSGRQADASRHIRDYVTAAESADQDELAAQQLGWMFDAAEYAPELRAEIVRYLIDVGVHDRTRRLGATPEVKFETPPEDRRELWSRVMEGALSDEEAEPDRTPLQG